MSEPNSDYDRVRPGFAAVVFGLPAVFVFLGTVISASSLYGYLAGVAWAGSLLYLAIRGFLSEEDNAFAPFENTNANLAPPLLMVFGILAWTESHEAPGNMLIVLGVLWTFAAPWWRPLWKSKPMRLLGDLFALARVILVVAILAGVVWSWIGS